MEIKMQTLINGTCECGDNQFGFNTLPILRLNCHCLACQKYTGQPYSDVCIFLKKHVLKLDINHTTFNRYRLPPNIQRGKCDHCLKPSLELALAGHFVLVPTANLLEQNLLPPAEMHIFYHRKQYHVLDDLPKYSGYLHSQYILIQKLAERLHRL